MVAFEASVDRDWLDYFVSFGRMNNESIDRGGREVVSLTLRISPKTLCLIAEYKQSRLLRIYRLLFKFAFHENTSNPTSAICDVFCVFAEPTP